MKLGRGSKGDVGCARRAYAKKYGGGGESETDVKEFAVKPNCLSAMRVVMTVTPVAKQPSAFLRSEVAIISSPQVWPTERRRPPFWQSHSSIEQPPAHATFPIGLTSRAA